MDSVENRRLFMDRLAEKHGVTDPFMWRKVQGKHFHAEPGGPSLLARYNGSLLNILSDVYPERKWSVVECLARPLPDYWDSVENRRLFLERAAEKFGVHGDDDWKRVSAVKVERIGGTQLLKRYEGSENPLFEALKDNFPEKQFSLFGSRPQVRRTHWDERETRRAFMEKLKAEHGIREAADWKRIALHHLWALPGGRSLMHRYDRCILTALRDCYPEERFFELECRPRVPNSFWKDVKNRRRVLEWVAEKQGIGSQEEWRHVHRQTVIDMGAGRLFSYYGSVYSALVDCFPEKEWDIYSCRPSIAGDHWSNQENVKEFLELLREELLLEEKEDWARVSKEQVTTRGGAGLYRRMPLSQALKWVYPGEDWSCVEDASKNKRSTQRLIMVFLRQLLPASVEIIEEYLHKDLGSSSESGRERYALELDFYLPKLQLGLEYNGEHHYHELAFFGPLEQYQKRDREKQELCQRNGIKLVTIPYWWDRTPEALAATLASASPGLLEELKKQA